MLETQITTTQTAGAGWSIQLAGEVGPWDALRLDDELFDVLDRRGRLVVVDLGGVVRLDPLAVQVLGEAAERQRAAGGELLVAAGGGSRLSELRPVVPEALGRLEGLHPALDQALIDRRVARRA